ncbi:hypothetical protein D3C87_1617000 [compost metagenome]
MIKLFTGMSSSTCLLDMASTNSAETGEPAETAPVCFFSSPKKPSTKVSSSSIVAEEVFFFSGMTIVLASLNAGRELLTTVFASLNSALESLTTVLPSS